MAAVTSCVVHTEF